MARIPRLILFSTTTIFILLAFASGMFAYTVFLNTSPFAYTEIFPRNILTGISVLCPIVLVTGLLGCCGLYRLSSPFLKVFTAALLVLCGLTVMLGLLAMRETNVSLASRAARDLWYASSNQSRETIMKEFTCCEWDDEDTLGVADELTALDTDASPVSPNCMADRTCSGPVTRFRMELAPKIATVMYCTAGFDVLTMIAASSLLLILRAKRTRKDTEMCSNV